MVVTMKIIHLLRGTSVFTDVALESSLGNITVISLVLSKKDLSKFSLY